MKAENSNLTAAEAKTSLGWADGVLLLGLFGLLWSVLHFGRGMIVHFDENSAPPLSMDIRNIPYYAGRTVLRMWIAFFFSLMFTMSVGYVAAKSRFLRPFILSALDVLQSVPVLGFLSITVTGFIALFPGSLMGVECASIFAIFTGQVWNMAFGFYHSMVTIPTDMQDAAFCYRLNRWQRFSTVEAPASVHSLIWNSMMSFGGGWFFVLQSEAISVMNKNIKLPGIGSYMAMAQEKGDVRASMLAIAAMIIVVVASDQLIWRPILVWADRFKIELTESGDPPTSWLYNVLRGTSLFEWIGEKIMQPVGDWLRNATVRIAAAPKPVSKRTAKARTLSFRIVGGGVCLWIGYYAIIGILAGIDNVHGHVTGGQFRYILWLGFLTLLRVIAMTVAATLIWTPIGVWIGSKPNVARIAQPIAQIAASFPVNMTFPFMVGFFVAYHVSINWGSILLIAMGTQWYILFNVIAGAMAIPNDLKEAARTYGLRGWPLWTTLILPAIFPFWVTGACTAAGGAWNASVVAELATYGNQTLKADGLGAFIADATTRGDVPMIISSIAVMSLFVIVINKLVWRRLYGLAERRFRLD
jgi:NitT/TauT family transport system permease protein